MLKNIKQFKETSKKDLYTLYFSCLYMLVPPQTRVPMLLFFAPRTMTCTLHPYLTNIELDCILKKRFTSASS